MESAQPELLFNGSAPKLPGGYRLRRLEMLNWGTFHNKVWSVAPEGRWTLVVGENGSGKSTAVDALRTLLVPRSRLNYNDASGEQKRRDRTRHSYIRGAWATGSDESSVAAITQYLRSPGTVSILLGVFENSVLGTAVTLAQLLWLSGDDTKEIFLLAREDRNIPAHLSHLGETRTLKDTLEKRGWEVCGKFTAYAEKFRALLGIPGEGAMEVFNQTIGVKEIPEINGFVRRHMLEATDSLKFIRDTLQPQYDELMRCDQVIGRTEDQIRDLAPIVELYERMLDAQRKQEELRKLLQELSRYYAWRHFHLRQEEAVRLNVLLAELAAKAVELDRKEQDDRKAEVTLNVQLASGEVGLRIAELTRAIDSATERKNEKFKRRRTWQQALQQLDPELAAENDQAFTALRKTVAKREESLGVEKELSEQASISKGIELRDVQEDLEEKTRQLAFLDTNQVNIDEKLSSVRDYLCTRSGIDPEELPFVGELLEVKNEHVDWTGAINKLMRSFGISLLVPERHYPPVAREINSRDLRLMFVFFRVPQHLPATVTSADPRRVNGRLRYRSEHPLSRWVAMEATRRFRHICCRDADELTQVDEGLTVEGFVREGSRHVKDDRSRVNDATRWVLGWSVEAKREALKEAIAAAEAKLLPAKTAVAEAQKHTQKLQIRIQAAEQVLAVETYNSIDPNIEVAEIEGWTAERDDLETKDNQRQALKSQLESVLSRMAERKPQIEQNQGELAKTQERVDQNDALLADLGKTAADIAAEEMEALTEAFTSRQSEAVLSVSNIRDAERRVESSLSAGINTHEGRANTASREMGPKMADFLKTYSEHATELDHSEKSAPRFAELKITLEKDDLPRYRERFRNLLSRELIGGVATFKANLEKHERANQARIDTINGALKRIPYTNLTHVQIALKPNRSDEIAKFRAALRECLSGGLQPTEDDRVRIFEDIKKLMAAFAKDENWAKRVTDARNWVDFGVVELANDDGREVDNFSGSGGRSGGQKTRLAFTILASAIAAQYGLAEPGDHAGRFRLVVIDEAFARTDEVNSQQALQLLQRLDLQLLIVSPFDARARTAEDFVHSFHLTVNHDRKDSRVRRASREEYEAAREEALASE